jgi:hypothetical protein
VSSQYLSAVIQPWNHSGYSKINAQIFLFHPAGSTHLYTKASLR